ncbi:RES family NAD+ phosphorylase [Brenneria populi subsp. brevivirga]|uniref:RES family NAD+ phosphorylase n=1 Tax=Brenneria populi TaxID=1505588 RepID=UPI002E17C8CD|nr:RES family NAD+ phosphorylase [Brenneria populi subsp. brevivirga]
MAELAFYRLVKQRYAATAFDGYGARIYGGRWNSPGKSCVYLGSTKALCVLENLAHLELADLAHGYCMMKIRVPEALVASLDGNALPDDWRSDPAPQSTRRIGDEWLGNPANGLVLRVPSTITGEWNALFNTQHPVAETALRSVATEPFLIDPRLVRQ